MLWTVFYQCQNAHHTDNSPLLTLGSPQSPRVIPSPPKLWDGLGNSPGCSKTKWKKGKKEGRQEGSRERKEGRVTSGFRPARTPPLLTEPLSLSFWSFVSTVTWHFLKGDKTGDKHSTSDFPLREGSVMLRKGSKSQGELVSRPKTWEGQLIWILVISLDL